MNSQTAAIAGALILFLALIITRKRSLDLTCSGVFVCGYIVFVGIGVLCSPWTLKTYLPVSLSYIHWEYITDRDLTRAILTTVLGILTFLVGNVLADVVKPPPARLARDQWLYVVQPMQRLQLGYNFTLCLCLYLTLVVVATAMFSTKLDSVFFGFYQGYIRRDQVAYYAARESMQGLGLLYYIIIFNALPFVTMLIFISLSASQTKSKKKLAYLFLLPPLVLLATTFEKTNLILFILLTGVHALLARIYTNKIHLHLPRRFSVWAVGTVLKRIRRQLSYAIIAAMSALTCLYAATTNVLSSKTSLIEGMFSVFLISVDRIFLRLSVMPLMYMSYYPAIEPFYGLSNVGKIATVLNIEYYPDTKKVLHYFTGVEEGGGAIGSITDFYGGFGWPGLFTGCVSLGFILRVVDRLLLGSAPTLLNRVFWVFLLYVSWYLSQASVFRCLSSYGGLTFAILTVFLSQSSSPQMRSAQKMMNTDD